MKKLLLHPTVLQMSYKSQMMPFRPRLLVEPRMLVMFSGFSGYCFTLIFMVVMILLQKNAHNIPTATQSKRHPDTLLAR